jgi:hypothetical protein
VIKYLENRKIWVYEVNGKILKRSVSKEKLEEMVAKEFGHTVTNDTVKMTIPKSEFSVKERFEFIEEFTKLVARGIIPSLIVTGSGGLGKTHTVTETLKKIGKVEDTIGSYEDSDFLIISGYSTPRSLYETLYDHNGKIIIFDDCDSVFKDPTGANLLKAALDSKDKRILSWGSASKDDEYPSRFEFIGKVIFISNLSIDKFPQAVLSRSMLADITLNTDEKIERIEQVFMEEKKFSNDDKKEVIAFIRENASKFKDLNIRSAFNAMKMKVAIGDNWQRMALYSATLN